jgi:hypothetical protein
MSLDISLSAVIETEVVSKNITHNLTGMWHEAGVYDALYNSEGKTAAEVLPVLEEGLKKMMAGPEHYKQFDSPNGWGTYKHAVPWLAELIIEFKQYPQGVIRVDK